MYQQGNFTLTNGQTDYTVNFSSVFPSIAPSLILTDIFNSNGDDPQDFLDGVVVSRTTSGFTFSLVTPPTNSNYVLSWVASDGLGMVPITNNGIPISSFPIFNKPSIPDNTLFPVVLPNGSLKSVVIRWSKIKSLMASAHQHLVADISDAGSVGSAVLKATTTSAGRAALEAAAVIHNHTADQISNASVIGRSILTGADAAAIRAILNVPEVSHTHTVGQLSDITEMSYNILTEAENAEQVRNLIEAPGLLHSHTISDISDMGSVGVSLAEADTPEEARSASNSLVISGWENSEVLNTNRNLSTSDFGNKFYVSSTVTLNIPAGITSFGKVGFYSITNGYLNISTALGVSLLDYKGTPITGTVSLEKGFYVLEAVGLNTYVLVGYETSYQRGFRNATTAEEAVAALDLNVAQLAGVSEYGSTLVSAETNYQTRAIATSVYTVATTQSNLMDNIPSGPTVSPSGMLFLVEIPTLDIADCGDMGIGQSFSVQNVYDDYISITTSNSVTINDLTQPLYLAPGERVEFVKAAGFQTTEELLCNYVNTLHLGIYGYVSTLGNDLTGQLGNIDKPFLSAAAVLSAVDSGESDVCIKILPGEHTQENIKLTLSTSNRNIILDFSPGASVLITDGTALFTVVDGTLTVTGGDFNMVGTGGRFALVGDACTKFYAKINGVNVVNNLSEFSVIRAYDNTSGDYYFEADYVITKDARFIDLSASSLTAKVRRLTVGLYCFDLDTATLNLNVTDGFMNCASSILSSGSTNSILDITLINSKIFQGVSGIPANDRLIDLDDSTLKVRITGTRSRFTGTHASNGIINLVNGTVILSGLVTSGLIYVEGGTLVLDSVHLINTGGALTYYLDGDTGNTIRLQGTCFTDISPNYTNLEFLGGNIITDPALSTF